MPTKVFFCEPTGVVEVARGYECESGHWHRREVGRFLKGAEPAIDWAERSICPDCGKSAKITSSASLRVFRRTDTGDEITTHQMPPGAAYDEGLDHGWPTGFDGRSMVVILPTGRPWFIDGVASNCTRPHDKAHRCWVRHGKPEDGTIHVDKNGTTCSAGAGSIAVSGYHGFLHNGYLTDG